MIRAEKYMQLEQCTLNVAAAILGEIQQMLALPLPELEGSVASRLGDVALANLQGAINVLFLLGIIDYDDQNDVFLFLEEGRRGVG